MLTFLPLEKIDEMEKWEGSQLNEAKDILAYELTSLVHGEEEAVSARDASKALFSTGSAANMPTETISTEIFNEDQIDILQLLISANLATSRNEARRAVEQGGVSVNGEKVTDSHASYTKEDFAEEFILKKGKKKFCKVELEA